jgi:hypothetical protein
MPGSTRQPSAATGSDALLYALIAAAGIVLVYGSAVYLTGNLANLAYGYGGWSGYLPAQAALHPSEVWPTLGPRALLFGTRIVPAVLTLAVAAAGTGLWLRAQAGRQRGMAGRAEVAPLTGKAIARRAMDLRPSLSGRRWKRGRGR